MPSKKAVRPFRRPTNPSLPPNVSERLKSKIYARFTVIGPAETIIRNVRNAIGSNQTPNSKELHKLLDGLERILAGETPNGAFGFWPGRGRPRDEEFSVRDQFISDEVKELRRDGMRLGKALELVAARYGKSESVINKIYQTRERLERKYR